MITRIYKGDATNANGRTILINLPDEDMTGLSVVFEFYGHRFVDNAPQRGGSMRVDFSAEETSVLPLGTHFAKLGLIRNGIEYTASATIPVCVSDDVAEVYGGDAANINLEMRLCSGIPDLSDIDHAPNTSYALADAFRALLNKLQSGVCISLALVCAFCHGAAPAMAPKGAIPFDQLIVTNQTEAFAPMSHVENQLNPHRVTAKQVGAATPTQVTELIQDLALAKTEVDNFPEYQSDNLVRSGGVFARLEGKQDSLSSAEKLVLSGESDAYVRPGKPLNLYSDASDGSGGSILVGGNYSAGGVIKVEGGGDYGGKIEVDGGGTPASIKKDGKEVATEDMVESKADEFSGWSFSGDTSGYDLSLEYAGGIWTLYHLGYVDLASAWADEDATRLDFDLGFGNGTIVATRGRVLRTGDPGLTAAFDAWRTNDNQVALGNSSSVTAAKGMAIGLKTTTGRTTIAAGASSIAFGIGAQTAAAGAASIALGANATVNASSAVQIGQGVNSEAETLQFRSYRLLNADGTIPPERLGASVTAETVTNVVERVRDLIYDEKRNITWRRVMYDGNLYYVAVTNADIVAEGN